MIILIVDDSENTRNVVTKSLKSIKNISSILHADDVGDGVEKIIQHNPDILILDFMLKSGTGLDVIKKIKNLSPQPYIVLYSNFLPEEYSKIKKDFKIDAVFDKSNDIIELVQLIEKLSN
jgi:DNA-binding NarL/FixJ family response regulator